MYETIDCGVEQTNQNVDFVMNISEEHIDLFDSYLSGSLSEKEIMEFDARLAYDADFREQFESYKRIEIGIKQHHRNQMKSKFAEVDEQLDGKSIRKTRHLKWWVISGAAAVAIIIGTIYLNQCNSSIHKNTTLVAEYWPHEEGLPVKMSSKGRYDDAMNAFKQEQWKKAEGLLLKIDSDTASYFLGIVSYEEKDYEQALGYFKEVDAVSAYFDEAQFRLALISILTDDVDQAKVLLERLIDKDTDYSKKAKELLSELE